MNWKEFWQTYPERNSDLDAYQQVGKTIKGNAISEKQFKVLINDVVDTLELKEDDVVMDLCCGNGLITKEFGTGVKEVVGLDFSAPLIEHANKNNKLKNIKYLIYDAKELDNLKNGYDNYFSKVLCYEALAFFNEKEFSKLLDTLIEFSKPNAMFYFASVLDGKKKFNFFNTFRKKMWYLKMKFTGEAVGLGKWWKMSAIKKIVARKGLKCTIFDQNQTLHTEHFRTDILIKK